MGNAHGFWLYFAKSQLEFSATPFLDELKTEWNIQLTNLDQKKGSLDFTVDGQSVSVKFNNEKIGYATLQPSAEISWLWKNAEVESAKNKSYYAVSVTGKGALETNKLFTKIVAAVLDNTNSSGIFIPNRFLLLSKGYYLESAKNMTDQELPLYLWVYFGLLQNENKSSGYTFGMPELGFNDIEIIDSGRNLQEVHAMVYEIAHIVLLQNRRLKDGESVENSENQMVKVSLSPAKFVEDTTVKLDF